jgi:hypothetical protein
MKYSSFTKQQKLFENWRRYVKENEEETQDPVDAAPVEEPTPEEKESIVNPKQAFQNTDQQYLEDSVARRNPGADSVGSIFEKPQTLDDLVNAKWEKYPHPAINSPAVGFKASIPGYLGVAEIAGLPDDQPVRFQPAHFGKATVQDKKSPKFGMVLAEVVTAIPTAQRETKHTTLLVGPSREDPKKFVVWTFHPGDPTPRLPDITMEDIKKAFNSDKDAIMGTVGDAKRLKYKFVKHVDKI